MTQKTCAACDYPLDANAISVTIGGKTVEVCCDACAVALKEAHAAAGAQNRAATGLSSIALAAVLLLLPATGALAAAEPIRIADAVQSPTLASAKQAISRWLADAGERQLSVGSAAFDGNGNISVEVVNIEGIPVRHFIIDGRTHAVAVAQAAKKGGHLVE